MGTLHSFRKAYSALKDSTTVGLAKVNSEFKELEVAIVKATNHVESPPKERHIRKIFAATAVHRPRTDIEYCIHTLSRRLVKTRNWIVAIKVLIVIHRTLRESDPTFRDELMNYSRRGHVLRISGFKDDSSPLAWDCSAWVRTYALFLEERLECFRSLNYDIVGERLRSSPAATKVHSRTRLLTADELLEQLPALQQLLFRLMGCQPEGAACSNYLVQYALALVMKESFKIYCAINDGIINLVDLFFEMPKHDAVKALNIYKQAGLQAEALAGFYEFCRRLELARNFQFPTLRQPPSTFLATMEEYVREAPQIDLISHGRLEYQAREDSHEKTEEDYSPRKSEESEKQAVEVEEDETSVDTHEEEEEPESVKVEAEPPPLISTDADLLGLKEFNPLATQLEDNNALALAISPLGNDQASSQRGLNDLVGTSGWELALVTTPGNNISQTPENALAGGFNRLLLDSLYEDDAARRQIQLQNAGYGYNGEGSVQNPFEQQNDPFAMSNGFAPPTNVQMAMLAQQQQMFQQQSNLPAQVQSYSYNQSSNSQYPQQQNLALSIANTSGDPFAGGFPHHQTTMTQQGNHQGLI